MEIKGQFNKIIYYRNSNGYVVAIFVVDDSTDEEVVVNGYMGEIDLEKKYKLFGSYVEHPKYGIQFKVDSFEKIIAVDEAGLIKYLSSPQFVGIGPKFAATIVSCLGMDAVEKIKENPEILDMVPKMNAKRKQGILKGIEQESDENFIYLTAHHLTLKNIVRLKNEYENDLMFVLMDNPYQVIKEVSGIGFNTIDKFALSIGFEKDYIHRLEAISESVLMNLCMRNGDSYVSMDEFKSALIKEIGEYITDSYQVINGLIMDRRIVLEEDRVYHISQYNAENYISRYLANFPAFNLPVVEEKEVDNQLSLFENEIGISYQDKQLEAIKSFFNTDLMILTGGPGTGKTTIVRAMMELSNRLYPANLVQLIAPTGRAAKRLTELTGYEAKTIHSLLLWDKETGKFAKDEDNPLNQDILIIDEFSMVDTYLFYNLLKACYQLKKLIIIGDVDQLPSVAMGSVLRDLIETQTFKVISLDKIYRQKEGSDIISLAYQIKNNTFDTIPTQQDIRFFECEKADIKRLTLQVVDHALKTFDSLEEGFMNVQVLAPKHMGLNGINSLNVALQNEFNPKEKGKRELQVGYRTFRVHDKILQLKNQPDDDVFNGDIGILIDIIFANEDVNNQNRIICDFDGRIVEYTSDTFSNITHAYCMSVHKAQGSEYPIIIMPMDLEYGIMLQKRLIYTAVTRAYKNLIFIGDLKAFTKGIHTIDHFNRRTTLKEKIIQEVDFIYE